MTESFNDSLRYQAGLLDAMANNVSIAARGMADAFGEAGKALGDLASSFAGYMADQDHLKSVRDEQLRQAALMEKTEERAQRAAQITSSFAGIARTSPTGLSAYMPHVQQWRLVVGK